MGLVRTLLTWLIASAIGHVVYEAFLKEPWAKYLDTHMLPWLDRHERLVMPIFAPLVRFLDRRRGET